VIQSETAVAVSGNAIVVGYNDFRGFHCPEQGYQVTGWAFSLDGGQTWTDGGPLPGTPRTNWRGDPWLATGPDGTIYFASLWGGLGNLAVSRGTVTETGIDWSQPTILGGFGSYDKDAMAVDPLSGNVYVTYSRLGVGIWMHRSTNGGASFTPAVS